MKNESDRLISYYQMLSLLYVSIGCIVLSAILFSCSSPSAKNPLLLRADSLMETLPDSALAILESISSPEKFSGADRAFYALLLTQAKHKNAIPLEDDSLIKIAVDYYGDKERSVNAAKAHYYLGVTYQDMQRISFAVDEYLTAVRLMPELNEFLAIVYDNLGECYESDDLYDIAIDAYRKAFQILKGDRKQAYPLRGIARVFLLENIKDSALYYYHSAMDCALAEQDSALIGALCHDLAMVYNQKEDYEKADEFVSKAMQIVNQDILTTVCLLKAEVMLNLNKLDSACYYYNKDIDQLDVFGKAECYNGLCRLALKRGDWKSAIESKESYMVLYDSIQVMSDNEELARLMDKHQLEEYKRSLSEHAKSVMLYIFLFFLALIIISVFWFMLVDRKRKKRIIELQQELNHKRVDAILLRDSEYSDATSEQIDKQRIELLQQQIHLCKLMFQSTQCYVDLESIKKATQKELLDINHLRNVIKDGIWGYFVDVMNGLNEGGAKLTQEDQYFCVLILLNCSKSVVMELMQVSPEALKTRKNRIKNKLNPNIFKLVFESDYQYNTKR